MTVRYASPPRRRLAGFQHRFSAVLAQNHFAFEHVYELILVLMPVALRGGCSRLERANVDTELGEPGCPTEAFAFAAVHSLVEWWWVAGRAVKGQIVDVDRWHVLLKRQELAVRGLREKALARHHSGPDRACQSSQALALRGEVCEPRAARLRVP